MFALDDGRLQAMQAEAHVAILAYLNDESSSLDVVRTGLAALINISAFGKHAH